MINLPKPQSHINKHNLIKATLVFLLFTALKSSGSEILIKTERDSIKIYVQKAINIIKNRAVNSSKMNWDEIYYDARQKADKVKTIRETYPIIKEVLEKLGDSHSKFFPPETVDAYVKGYRLTGQPFPEVKAEILKNRYAYISLPSFYSYNMNEWHEFANNFRAALVNLEAEKPKGWILDLRDNEGGMFAPMYAAISPLIDQSNAIGWVDGNGKNIFFNFKDDKLFENKKAVYMIKLEQQKVKIKNPNLVVLINEKTASSGEFVAISFAGQKNTTIIGNKTNGLTSANQEHKLSDGAFLVLTEGITIDRSLKRYGKIGEGLAGDVKVGQLSGNAEKDTLLYLEKAYQVLDKRMIH
ncbi:S41 family peptidase [Pedobacter sp. UBA5917]|jgi:C-terminal processing protease CtpA/Prc|uniref:S41 family peptidase n=1 Tax=Pedobacter sp. UBA5917 TaxID=1947061 RepID=UPI0025EDBAF6|nr:S41 family peptidase [Pedobacter sp. UBA5917]